MNRVAALLVFAGLIALVFGACASPDQGAALYCPKGQTCDLRVTSSPDINDTTNAGGP